MGIASISLTPKPTGFSGTDTLDTVVTNTTSFTRTNGTTGIAYDVALARQLLSGAPASEADPSVDLSAAVAIGRFTSGGIADFAQGVLSTISAADAARWNTYLNPTAIAARRLLEAAGGSWQDNIGTIRSTIANIVGLPIGRGIPGAATRLQSVAIDMAGAGLDLVDPKTSSVKADVMHTGVPGQIGWVAPSMAVLAYHENGDGAVDVANETDFRSDVANAKTALQGLAAFDSNGDGVLSAADEGFARFLVWRDLNGNGVANSGEVQTLSQAGIAQVSLTSSHDGRDMKDNGSNDALGQSTVTMTDGSSHAAYDVAFGYADTTAAGPTAGVSSPTAPATGHQSTPASAATETKLYDPSPSAAPVDTAKADTRAAPSANVGFSRGAGEGPTGDIVQGADMSAEPDFAWWHQAGSVAAAGTDPVLPQASQTRRVGPSGQASGGSIGDAATLQRLQLLRQSMAAFQGPTGGASYAVWNRHGLGDAATLAAASLAPAVRQPASRAPGA